MDDQIGQGQSNWTRPAFALRRFRAFGICRKERALSRLEVGVVRDSGAGLAPATVEWIFDAFYTTKAVGLRMGLSIYRSIIEAHDGRLWAGAERSALHVAHGRKRSSSDGTAKTSPSKRLAKATAFFRSRKQK